LPRGLAALEERRVKFKQEASEAVINNLTKYFKNGKITSKEEFKHLSRKLTHKLMLKEEGKFFVTPKTPSKIKKFVDQYFQKKANKPPKKKDKKDVMILPPQLLLQPPIM